MTLGKLTSRKIKSQTISAVRHHPHYLNIVSGILAGSVFCTGLPGWLLPVFLLPLLYSYVKLPKTSHKEKTMLLLVSFFVPFHAVVLSWFLDANISALIGASKSMSLVAAYLSWIIMTIVITLPMIALIPAFNLLKRTRSILVPSILVACFWVVCEWARSMLFAGFLYGEGGSIGDYWNFGSMGLGLISTPVGFSSRFVGMYGLSFIVVFIAVSLFQSIRSKTFTTILICSLFIFTLTLGSYRSYSQDVLGKAYKASMLQNEQAEPEYGHETMIENKSDELKDLIVLPEYSRMFDYSYRDFAKIYVNDRLAVGGTSITVSDGEGEKWYGTLEFRDYTGTKLAAHTKEFLIPTGEYLPAILRIFYSMTSQSKITNQFEIYRQVHKGDPPQTYRHSDLTIGPVACSGILGRDIYRMLAQDGAQVLTNSASLIDFKYSQSYFRQSLQMASFHAIANNRPFIQSSLGAPAFAMDSNGSFIVSPRDSRTKFIDFSFSPKNKKTIYTLLGEWVLLTSGAAVLVWQTYALWKRKTHKRN
jgi:apolipoprotein N-acyltransferase